MFTEKLKALRTQLKLTQKEMGKRLSMEQSTYSRKERDNAPKPEFLERIKKFLGVDPAPWLRNEVSAADSDDAEALRIVHLEVPPASAPKRQKKRKGRFTKRDEQSLRDLIYIGVRYFKKKLKASRKARRDAKDLRGGGVNSSEALWCLSP